MILVSLLFALIGYMAIGAFLSLYWARESIKNADGAWNADAFLFRCCFKWPFMIANKDLR